MLIDSRIFFNRNVNIQSRLTLKSLKQEIRNRNLEVQFNGIDSLI